MDPLESVPIEELIAQYVDAAKRRGEATDAGDVSDANEHAEVLWDISAELRRRAAERSLLSLLEDDDPWVRFSAGTDALSFAPVEGEATLSALVRLLETPLGPEAMLALWREGRLPSP